MEVGTATNNRAGVRMPLNSPPLYTRIELIVLNLGQYHSYSGEYSNKLTPKKKGEL